MIYENELRSQENQKYDMFNPEPQPCYIDFFRRKITGYNINYHESEHLLRIHTNTSNVFKKSFVLDYLHARLTLSNLGYQVTKSGICRTAETIKVNRHKNEITTCRRMITKISNQINDYENYQKTLLIPDFEFPEYVKAKLKLKHYQEKLQTLLDS